ncbi:hypothetical protein JAAARDRAFT_167191 [Jaapia argillacea MUCL 33604]|uniref:Kinesin motor domain-containing protein n=1 Tax=Jaapia argillacea MUCL 33604 TaxID=933084 RepID=A0A067QCI3_9AGAM|nr:hypothetical protein JAAARDRAFT_167191 [Jaapia argillacea MUCL 33604]
MVAAGSITVAVRVRPPSSWEAARLPEPSYDTCIRGDATLSTPGARPITSQSNIRDIVQVVDDRILTFDPPEQDNSRAFVERGFMPPGSKRYKDKRFMFDRVFNHEARQIDVYESTAKPLLQPLLNGFNATVFAYGATGCGKTHTISGSESDPGVIYLTMADLFQRIDDRKDEYIVEVTVTFLEIYNEEIRDLLSDSGSVAPRGGLQIREDKTVKVVGLTELRPNSAEEVKAIVLAGNLRRTQSPTHANETSSRSHAVLQVHVNQSPRTASLTEERTVATLSIIDLAGSERAAATSNMGQRMVEGANINKSLLALGNCINALCESGGATRHVPYRNSKLTRLLKFSLGGNCKTVMIVCIAPTSIHFDDTHNTLLYAERATKIKTRVVTRNVVNVDRHVGQYVEAINRLNAEVAELKAKLAGRFSNDAEVTRRKKVEAKAEVERARTDMQIKADQTKNSIVDGASCSGKISVAQAKLRAIRSRLGQLNALASASAESLPSDLAAERGLLQSLAVPEEQAVKPESALNIRLQRSSNSGNMFDALLRAVSERKSDKLDEVSVDNVKLDAKFYRAEMERYRAEAERNAMREAVEMQAEVVVNLVGMVGRCTVMLGDASRVLRTALDEGRDGLDGAVRAVAASLKNVAEGNDEAFEALIGHSTAGYAVPAGDHLSSSLGNFTRHASSYTQRNTSGPVVSQQPKVRASRRSSSYGSAIGSPGRKGHRNSPRRSLRSSMAPYGRAPAKEKEKKGVQWRDEAGQGDIDDGGLGFGPVAPIAPPIISITSPEREATTPTLAHRNGSVGGSESEWEDEKTEDSVNLSLTSIPPPRDSTNKSASSSKVLGVKRPRASRLDPSFLKSRGSALGSLAEDDEDDPMPRRVVSPLGNRNVNTPDSSSSGSSSGGGMSTLHIPKGRDRHGSPSKRVPGTPKVHGHGGHAVGKGRRRSSIGPLRSEKSRRRSSMIPQLSPQPRDSNDSLAGGVRRVPVNGDHSMRRSPAKRPKRLSLLGSKTVKERIKAFDPNASLMGDLSMKGPRPTWK